ncbi:MAG: PVC-type heme-binding CxxCH protein, partial [Planctomycetia bacterium]
MPPRVHRPLARVRGLAGLCLVALAVARAVIASPPVAPTEALTPEEERAKFRLPPGFEIQLVAAEPQIQKPMNMAFDARGRLWVTHSVEYPFAAAANARPRDGVTILEDFGPDGRAGKATLFADGLNIPIGVLPLPSGDAAIVWSIPNIWKLTDTDHDGRADRREVLYGPFDFVDTHGDQNAFRLGADGWVYACHGFRNASKGIKLRGEGEVVLTMESGNTYRFRPDGSAIEQVTSGQVNPFGMCFDVLGNQFVADCHSKPVTMLLRGGCYESFGRPHDGLGFAPAMTGSDHGSTGIAAVAVYEADGFPADHRGSMFVGNVVTNRVHRDVPQWRGSSPWVEKPEDFLVCDDWWFRPVDLQLGPDGGLYVADFYNCIVGHYEVDLKHSRRDRHRGRIWRVVATGVTPPEPRDLTVARSDALLAALGDPNQTVRRLACEQIVERFRDDPATVAALVRSAVAARPAAPAELPAAGGMTDAAAVRAALAVRALARLGRLEAATLERAASDPATVVRVHAVKAAAEITGAEAARQRVIATALADPDPFVRRAAAEAAAARPAAESFPPLVRCLAQAPAEDTHLRQAVRIAIREHLEQLDVERLDVAQIPAEQWPAIGEIAACVPSEPLAWMVFGHVRDLDAPLKVLARSCGSVVRDCGEDRRAEAVACVRQRCGGDLARQADVLGLVTEAAAGGSRPLVADDVVGRWAAAFADDAFAATGSPVKVLALAARLAVRLGLTARVGDMARLLADRGLAAELRTTLPTALIKLDAEAGVPVVAALLGDAAEPLGVRDGAAGALGDIDAAEAREPLVTAIASAPAGLQRTIALDEGGEQRRPQLRGQAT